MSIALRFQSCTDWSASKRAKRRRNYWRRGDFWRKPSHMRTTSGSATAATCPSSRALSEQWFLRYPKTKEALAVVRDHLIRFFPAHWEKVYAQWLENIRDWCISRQVWWGHRIPAWYRKAQIRNSKSQIGEEIYVGIEPPPDPENWIQDEDTVDTWFSSWLWAYETMDPQTRKKFYPTSVLVTAARHHFLLGRANDHCRARVQAG